MKFGTSVKIAIAIGLMVALFGVGAAAVGVYLTKQPAPNQTGTSPPPEPSLSEDERALLWDIEHHGNLLARGQYGFKSLATALRNADPKAFREEMTPDFTGKLLSEPREVQVKTAFAEVTRLEDSGKPGLKADSAGFIGKLLEFRKPFIRQPEVKFSLMKLTPVVREDLKGLWEGTCQLRMFEKTSPSDAKPLPPREVIIYLKYQILQPTEEQLKQGGWLRSCEITQSQVAYSPSFLLRDVTRARNVNPDDFWDNWKVEKAGQKSNTSSAGGVYLCDFNHDGYMDMLVTDVKHIALFQGGPGGVFEDVTSKCKVPATPPEIRRLGVTAAFADLDGDGWEDLILGGHIYRNVQRADGGRAFEQVFSSNLRNHVALDVGGFIVGDYDRDGLMDIYVTRPGVPKGASWIDGKSGNTRGNQLLRNKGNWQFEDVTKASGTDGELRSTFTALWLDANGDGWPDLYVPNEFGAGLLLLNNGDGTFRKQLIVDGPGDFGTMGAIFGDFENSGHPGLYMANMYSKAGSRVIGNLKPDTYPEDTMAKMRRFVTGSQLYRSHGTGPDGNVRFEPVGKRFQLQDVGWSYGPAFIDLDNDGYLDLYATCGYISKDRAKPDG